MSELETFHDEVDASERLIDTRVSDDAVKDYLRNIGKTPLLNAEEEIQLAQRIEAGLVARDRLKKLMTSMLPKSLRGLHKMEKVQRSI